MQLRIASDVIAGPLEGMVEEVDTGKQSQFRSENELIAFLRGRFAAIPIRSRQDGQS